MERPDTQTDERDETPVDLPETLIPAPLISFDGRDEDRDLSADETRVQLRALERLGLGFELPPFDPRTSEVMVRGAHRKILQGWLEMGAFLLQARLVLGKKPFWEWFDGCKFPFSPNWARQSIKTVAQLNMDPVLHGLAKRMTSIKHFQLVAKRLSRPDGREEWEASGTIHGRTLEDLEAVRVSHFNDLKAGDTDPGAANDQQKARERLEKERIEAGKKSLELEVQLKERTEELLQANKRLAMLAHPHLNATAFEKDFLEHLEKVRVEISNSLAELRPMDRRDVEGLSAQAVAQFYAVGILWEKQIALLLRELEVKWGDQMPELLLDETGKWREPAHRAELKILRDDIRDAREAVAASAGGGRLTIVSDRKENRGEILFSSEDAT